MASTNPQTWVGWTVLMRLKNPPVALTGKIERLVPGENVTLVNVWIENKEWRGRLVIASNDIADLQLQENSGPPAFQQPTPPVAPAQRPPTGSAYQNLASPTTPIAPNQYSSVYQGQQHAAPPLIPAMQGLFQSAAQPVPAVSQPSKSSFVDPAIVSMGKPPVKASHHDVPLVKASSQTGMPFSSLANRPLSKSSDRAQPSPGMMALVGDSSRQETPTGSLIGSMEGLTVRAELADETVGTVAAAGEEIAPEVQENQPGVPKKIRRRNRKKNAQDAAPEDDRQGKRGKGWRETPMLEDTASFQPYKALRRNKGAQTANDNGWASEDVTDVQEMPEFDFEGSLKKFDKRTLFNEMRENDQIDDAERLVSHNRRPKPGTAGGKNLHYTENVLDIPTMVPKPDKAPPDDYWKSEADDGILNGNERLSGRELGSRQGSRRPESKTSSKPRSQSRKASTAAVGQAPTRVNSGASVRDATKGRRMARNVDTQKQPSTTTSSAGFYAAQPDRRIEILSPLQMLNLENIAQNDLGLTEDMMTENAGRGIAEVALHTLTDPAIKVRLSAADGDTLAPQPTVVILVGNNKSGFRSIAAGRHLRCKGINVIICVVGIERGERDLSVDMTKQLRLFKSFGGKVCGKSELFEHVRQASIPVISMDAPRSVLPQAPPMAVTLIIDALLGHVTPFEDLRASEQATVYELIEWTNRNEAFVLAVDVPTGIDHTTGKPTIQDGHSLYIRPRYVVSVGAPKKGLFEAVAMADVDDNETVTGHVSDDSVLDWSLFLVDIGLGAAVWKRAGTKIRRGIDFGNKWALQMKYRSGADQAEE
ncbi:Enhancer of mRNA-decapping protein 3 [Cytospora mali]|uniref:Enhancer of mRNA-decapping protein 3 n=1 Tax=Cytospora mali TaxID=578113 RepID=A0A194VKX2_CYTMA|nr:Enhancer of mRNA-decapping protein 3 [Valsa mali]